MVDVHIRLRQEGIVRAFGYQVTQWASVVSPGATDPASYAGLFVIRNGAGGESLERVASLRDFISYAVNELKYFEAKNTGGNALLSALAGDSLIVTPAVSEWLQSGAPYDTCTFTVDAVTTVANGTAPATLTGNRIQLPGYEFSDDDVGRWVTLTGFTTSAYNATVRILSFVGNTATVDATLTTNETGATWAFRRVRIVSDLGPSSEPRYFPTRRRQLGWELRRSGSLLASGVAGETQRQDPRAELYRDVRFTAVVPTEDDANALFAVTRDAVGRLQRAAEAVDTAFAGLQTYDYPPV